MSAVSLHGVTIAWSLSGPVRDPVAEVLSMFEPAPPVQQGPAPSPTVRLEVRPATPSAAADPRGEGWEPSFFHSGVQAFRGPKGFLIWDRVSRVLVPPGGTPVEVEIAPVESEVTEGSTTHALQIALILALRPLGYFHMHAAAVVLPSGVPVLVVGGRGAGKTTTTLALLEAGADYLCDDALYLTEEEETVRAIAFAREFRVGPTTFAMFPRLAPLAGPPLPHTDKRPVDPREAYPGRFRPFFSLSRADHPGLALFPSITAAPVTAVVPLARAEAFGCLLGSSATLIVDGVPGRDENLAALKGVIGGVECYEVRFGADAIADPGATIAAQVERLRRPGGP